MSCKIISEMLHLINLDDLVNEIHYLLFLSIGKKWWCPQKNECFNIGAVFPIFLPSISTK